MKKRIKKNKIKQKIFTLMFSFIIFALISFSGISTVLASGEHSNISSYFDINSLINELRARFSSNNILKIQVNLKLAREDLNSLRKININKLNDSKLVIEILNKTEESFTNNSNLLNIVEDKFRQDPNTIPSLELINLLAEFRDISITSQDLLNQIRSDFQNSNSLSLIDKLDRKAYVAQISAQSTINDLSDDNRLNLSMIDKINIKLIGILVKNGNRMQIKNQDMTFNLNPGNDISNRLLNKQVEIEGMLEKNRPDRLTVISIHENKDKNLSTQNQEIKGTLRQFGSSYYILVSNDYKKQYLLANTPYDANDYSDNQVLVAGTLSGSAIYIDTITSSEVKPLSKAP